MVRMAKAGCSLLHATLLAALLVAGLWVGPAGAQEPGGPPPAEPGAATQAPAPPDEADPRADGGVDQVGLLGVMLLLLFMLSAHSRRPRHAGCRCPVHPLSYRD